jgi:hypothetical protein
VPAASPVRRRLDALPLAGRRNSWRACRSRRFVRRGGRLDESLIRTPLVRYESYSKQRAASCELPCWQVTTVAMAFRVEKQNGADQISILVLISRVSIPRQGTLPPSPVSCPPLCSSRNWTQSTKPLDSVSNCNRAAAPGQEDEWATANPSSQCDALILLNAFQILVRLLVLY